MKINIEIDLTPAEYREIFGLPNVGPVQDEFLDKIREKMLTSVDTYDPTKLLAPYLPENMRAMEKLQRAIWEGLIAAGNPKTKE
jgi:hypothetical protein